MSHRASHRHTVILSSAPIKHLLSSAPQLSSILICNNTITSYSCVCVNISVSALVFWLIVIWPPSFVLAFMSPDLISNQCQGGYGGQVEAITVVVSSMTVSPSADTATRHHEPDCIVLLLIVSASSCRGGPHFHFLHFSFRLSAFDHIPQLLTTCFCICPDHFCFLSGNMSPQTESCNKITIRGAPLIHNL